MRLHHIGVATANLRESIDAYAVMGFAAGEVIHDPLQKVDICFLEKDGDPVIELVCPANAASPVGNILRKNGTMPYHTCYEVKNLEVEIARLRAFKFVTALRPLPAVAFGMRRVCFLYNKAVGLIELLESAECLAEQSTP